MIIEHSDARELVDTTYKETGKVSVYDIEIDKQGLSSAWTPVLDRAKAYEVVSPTGKTSYLYRDELDNYARMFQVPEANVTTKHHLQDIVNPEHLPAVGHLYREARERDDLEKKLKAEMAENRKREALAVSAYHSKLWDMENSVNRMYGNIFDTGEGKDAYVEKMLSRPNYPLHEVRIGESVKLSILDKLNRYEELTGHSFVANLDDESNRKERFVQLRNQLNDGLFLEEHGFIPEVRVDHDHDEDNEVMLIYSLNDRHAREVAEIKVIFPESMAFEGCVAEPFIAEITYRDTGDILEYEVDLDDDPLHAAFSNYLMKHYDGAEWVIDEDNIMSRGAFTSTQDKEAREGVSFYDIKGASDIRSIRLEMKEVPEIGVAIAPHAAELDRVLKEAPPAPPTPRLDEQRKDIDEDNNFSP